MKTGKAIALFPGSFKPPHVAHLHGIRYMLDREDVESVVIIISNRARLVPDTHLALDAESARVLMNKLLQCAGFPMKRIRVEVARHRATSHAMAYLDKRLERQAIYFCVGNADSTLANKRFPKLAERAKQAGKQASIVVLPKPPQDVHATEIRTALGCGAAGRSTFFAALPDCLQEIDRRALWLECLRAIQPMENIARRKVRDVVAMVTGIEEPQLQAIDGESANPDFVLQRNNLPDFIVKYAGDTTGSSEFSARQVPKPARRLAVERRVIRHVAAHCESSFLLPTVEHFDTERRILILGRIGRNRKIPDQCLADVEIDLQYVFLAGRFLGHLHRMPLPAEPFWGDNEKECEHWHALISRLGEIANRQLASLGTQCLRRNLPKMAASHAGKRILHLDFTADKITTQGENILVSDFERAGSFGDCAYDVATIVASLCTHALLAGSTHSGRCAIASLLAGYEFAGPPPDDDFWQRMMIYAACCLLSPFHLGTGMCTALPDSQRNELAVALLEKSETRVDGEQAMSDVLAGFHDSRNTDNHVKVGVAGA